MKLPIKNSFWSFLESALNPIANFILTPVLIKYAGLHQFGLWVFSIAIVALGQMASFGVATALIKYLSALEDLDRKRHVVFIRAALWVALLGCVIDIVISVILSLFSSDLMFQKMGTSYEVSTIIVISGVLAGIYLLDELAVSVLHGMQRYPHSAYLSGVFYLLWLVGSVCLAVWNFSMLSIIEWSGLIRLIKFLVTLRYIDSRHLSGQLFVDGFPMEKEVIYQLLSFGKWQFVQTTGAALFNVFDRIFIGAALGAGALSVYGVCLQLAQLAQTVATASMKVLFPWVSALRFTADDDSPDVFKLSVVGGGICLIVPGVICIFSKSILMYWVGMEFAINNQYLAVLLVISFGVLAFNVPVHFVLMGLGEVRWVSLVNIVAGIVAALVMWLLIEYGYGLTGIATSKILFSVLILFNFFILRKKLREIAQ